MPLIPTCMASVTIAAALTMAAADELVFHDDFKGSLRPGWTWVREEPSAWRVTNDGLEVRVQPGNMWGSANDARNVLVRPVPDAAVGTLEISVTVSNRPTSQYEQVDLVWYYDDRHMVKIGQEQVDGVLSLVMGREEADKTRTIAIVPIEGPSLDVRFIVTVDHDRIRGQFRTSARTAWKDAGECTLPGRGVAHVSLQAYQGPADEEHWARFSALRIARRAR